jgi:hypothetical protein
VDQRDVVALRFFDPKAIHFEGSYEETCILTIAGPRGVDYELRQQYDPTHADQHRQWKLGGTIDRWQRAGHWSEFSDQLLLQHDER